MDRRDRDASRQLHGNQYRRLPYDRLVNTVGHRYNAMRLPSWPLAQLLVFWGGRQHGFDAFRLNPVVYARAVQCPALVLVGENDPWVKVSEARAVAEAITGLGELHVFTGADHAAHVWRAPSEYRQVVGEWLDRPVASRKGWPRFTGAPRLRSSSRRFTRMGADYSFRYLQQVCGGGSIQRFFTSLRMTRCAVEFGRGGTPPSR